MPISAHHALRQGQQFAQNGELAAASVCYREAIALEPQLIDAYLGLGAILIQSGDLESAIAQFQTVIQLQPDCAEAHANLGFAHSENSDFSAAIASGKRALSLRSDFAEAHCNLSRAYLRQQDLEAAISHAQQAIALKPNYAKAYINLGLAYHGQNLPQAAIAAYQKALQIDPNQPLANFNLALSYLAIGNYAQGWRLYEWRWKLPQLTLPAYTQPVWTGDKVKTLLLVAEQGFGDMIMMAGYIPLVAQRCDRLLLQCPAVLVRLFRTMPEIEMVFDQDQTFAHNFDEWITLMSLPAIFYSDLEHFPNSIPNFSIPANSHIELQPNSLKIGIVWQTKNSSDRSFALSTFLPFLVGIPNLSIYSLQIDGSAEISQQVSVKGIRDGIIDLSDRLTDFYETATLIQSLDLIITIDTAVAHLAAALAKPTWILLPFAADWRWLLARADSPWYASARLFRQPHIGNWQVVFSQVKSALIELGQTQANKYLQAGNLAAQLQDWQTATGLYKQAIATFPIRQNSINARFNLATAFKQLQQLDLAIAQLQTILELDDQHLPSYQSLGNIYAQRAELPEAIAAYQKASQLAPHNLELRLNLGYLLDHAQQLDQAIDQFQAVIFQQPVQAEAHAMLGAIYLKQFQLADSIHHSQTAIALNPQNAEALSNLGYAHFQANQHDQAIAAYHQALAISPLIAEIHCNLGLAYYELNQMSEAIAAYDQAIGLKPNYINAQFNRSLAILKSGDLAPGFRAYEWRWQSKYYILPKFSAPIWDGASLNGKTILIWSEGGFGDVIQFGRYLSLVTERGGKILLQCPTPLIPLLGQMVDQVFSLDHGTLPPYQVYAPLLSLPRIFATSLDHIPAPINFQLESEPLAQFSNPPKAIGIVWASGYRTDPELARDYLRRSCPIQLFMQLVQAFPQLNFYSLQVGNHAADLIPYALANLHDLSPLLQDFSDTVRLIEQLDLVISVDTAVAHLNATINQPTWTLLPFANDWRWLCDRCDSPWYPAMRLFRQSQAQDWQGVIDQVIFELRSHIA